MVMKTDMGSPGVSVRGRLSLSSFFVVMEQFCILIVVVMTRIYIWDKTSYYTHTETHTHSTGKS